MESEEYPSVRRALFGDEDKAANIWCGVKWVFWHVSHLLLALLLILLGIIIVPFALLHRGLTRGSQTTAAAKVRVVLHQIGSNPTVVKAFQALLVLVIAVLGVGALAFAVWFFLNYPMVFLRALGLSLGVVAGLFGGALLVEYALPIIGRKLKTVAAYFGVVREKSEGTPVARRVIGYCPVSMDINPRWFEKVFGKL